MDILKLLSSDWIEAHRQNWSKKSGLRYYYHNQIFDRIISNIKPGPTLQLGAGPGFFSQYYDGMLNSDFGNRFNVDVELDAHAIPLANGSFDNVVGVDILHHFARPGLALSECARILKPGGMLLLVEPWAGFVGNIFYKFMHHEECNDIEDIWNFAFDPETKLPMEGNSKIPKIIFSEQKKYLSSHLPSLQLEKLEYFGVLSYLLTGGFGKYGLPEKIINLLIKSEVYLSQAIMREVALRVFIILQKK